MDSAVAAAHSGIAHVYNWDFGLNKWVNFASGNKTSKIIIIERKKEFFVQVMPEDSTKQKFEYYLPADVQVTKTRDMIQFPVPDKRDATGGKLIAVRFKQPQLEAQFTSTASGKIRGFSLPLRASQSEQDLSPEEIFPRRNEVRDETFHVERLKDNYQPPTLPSTTLPVKSVPPPNGGIELSKQSYQPPVMPSQVQYHPPQRPPVNNEPLIYAHRGGPPPDVRDVPSPKPFSGENKPRLVEHSNNGFQSNDREIPPAPLNNLNVENPEFNDRVQHPPFTNDAIRRGHDKRSGEMDRGGFQDLRGGLPQVEARERGYLPQLGRPDPRRMDGEGYNVPQGGPDMMQPGRADGGGYHIPQGGLDQMHPKRMDGVGHQVYHGGMMREGFQDTRGHDGRELGPLYHGGAGVILNQRGGHYREDPNHGYQAAGRRPQDTLRDSNPMYYEQGEAHNNIYYKGNMGQFNAADLGPTPRKQHPMALHRPIHNPNPAVKPIVEPLQKPTPPPTPSASEPDIEDINLYSQRLAESITSGKIGDANELVNYLVELVRGSTLTSSIRGSFSFKHEEQEQEKAFSLEVIVEPLNGQSYPIYLEVQSSFTIEYLKVECQKRFKIPRECQYWIVGSQLAEDKKTLKELNIHDSCTTYIYIQHPHKAKVSKNDLVAIKLRQEQKKTGSNPDQPRTMEASMTGRSLEPPPMSRPNPDPLPMEPLNDSRAVFRSPGPLGVSMPPVPPPHGGVQTMPNEHPGMAHQINQNNDQFPVIEGYDGQDQEYVLKEKSPSLPPKPKVGWKCDICTFQNKPYRPGCEMCGSDRPQDYVPPLDYVPTEDEMKFLDSDIHGFEEVSQFLEMERQKEKEQAQENYLKLLNTDVVPVVTNEEEFECPVCATDIDPGDGIRLRGCLHMVCKDCLRGTVVHCEESEVKCPFTDGNAECQEPISEREIRDVLSDEELQAFHSRALRQAEASDPKSFHCKTPDCKGFCFYEDEVNEFQCQICQHTNCILCKAQHEGLNCQQYQNDLKIKAANDEAARQTQEMLENMVKEGEAMHCPSCQVIVTKKVGCDWIRCSMCKTEMCWATKGPRWGPKGRGDVTGGCKCGVNRQKCHPDCRNCH